MAQAGALSAAKALEQAKGAALVGQLRYTRHAEQRMEQRNVLVEDVRRALKNATQATWRPKDGNWKMSGGTDLDGAALDVGIAIDGNTVRVCTVY